MATTTTSSTAAAVDAMLPIWSTSSHRAKKSTAASIANNCCKRGSANRDGTIRTTYKDDKLCAEIERLKRETQYQQQYAQMEIEWRKHIYEQKIKRGQFP